MPEQDDYPEIISEIVAQLVSGDRAWAKEHGLAVSERGRIPASVVEQYQTANRR